MYPYNRIVLTHYRTHTKRQKRPAKDTYKRDLQERPTPYVNAHNRIVLTHYRIYSKRAERPAKETYTYEMRPSKETNKRDLRK